MKFLEMNELLCVLLIIPDNDDLQKKKKNCYRKFAILTEI